MKTLVVFDSAFGNTQKVAEAIGAALDGAMVQHIDKVQPEDLNGLDYLVVGGPTQRLNYTEAMRDFLDSIPPQSLNGVKVAAFDTRISIDDVQNPVSRFAARVFLHRYAAEPIANVLQKKGGAEAQTPAGFFVLDTEGPLMDGELERAAEWARGIYN